LLANTGKGLCIEHGADRTNIGSPILFSLGRIAATLALTFLSKKSTFLQLKMNRTGYLPHRDDL